MEELKFAKERVFFLNEPSDLHIFTKKFDVPQTIEFFDSNQKCVGTLWITDPMRFEGNAEESAKLFFDHLIKLGGV